MNNEKVERVRNFLRQFKLIASTCGIYFVPRDINLCALAELGLSKKNAKDEILSLSAMDYCEGPLNDRDKPGDVWIFGKQIVSRDVYIKLKIAVLSGSVKGMREVAKCISFHVASYPLAFPLRNKKGKE